jgi:NIMA (never in mitosis gene a)-related kinase
MDNFTKVKILGKGSFGQAWLVTRKQDSKQFVIKEIDISRMPPSEKEAAQQEAKVRGMREHSGTQRCCHSLPGVQQGTEHSGNTALR